MSARTVVALCAALVMVASAMPRVLVAAGSLPEVLRPFSYGDLLFTYLRGLSGHRLPYVDTPFEYPPLTGAIAGLLSLLSDDAARYVLLWSIVLAGAAAGGAWALAGEAGWRRTLWRWSLAPQLLLLAGINMDVVPAALAAWAAVLARQGRLRPAVVALALGTATKLYPAFSLPLVTRRARDLVVFGLVLAAFYLPTSLNANPSAFSVLFYAAGIEANGDSFWGLLGRGPQALGIDPQPLLVIVTLIGLLATYLIVVRARPHDPAVAFGLATTTLLLWSRLYSPQYSLWLLPTFVLTPLRTRTFALLSLADVGVFFTIYPLTLSRWAPNDPLRAMLETLLVVFVCARQAALLVTWRELWRSRHAT
ncbi:MAG: DUF2029 domain-containing protein [Chloroflexi bacterium]|nr:DUF2029 domain-containing protein [Chloroflexota bacterium]